MDVVWWRSKSDWWSFVDGSWNGLRADSKQRKKKKRDWIWGRWWALVEIKSGIQDSWVLKMNWVNEGGRNEVEVEVYPFPSSHLSFFFLIIIIIFEVLSSLNLKFIFHFFFLKKSVYKSFQSQTIIVHFPFILSSETSSASTSFWFLFLIPSHLLESLTQIQTQTHPSA